MSYQAWPNPDLQSIAGLNTQVVYGENVQLCVGSNHQIAIGNNFQFCINPGALVSKLGGTAAASVSDFAGSGLGGNMQLTIGTNTNIVWGRALNVYFGPDSVDLKADEQDGLTRALCLAVGAICVLFAIGYGACGDENGRASIVVAYEILMSVALVALMVWEAARKGVDSIATNILKELFHAADYQQFTGWQSFGAVAGLIATFASTMAPIIQSAASEGHFGAQSS